jgi:hypothetical protein
MRTLPALCCVIAFAACGSEQPPDVVDESTFVTESSTSVLIAPDPMTMVGGCRERPRSTMSRALHDAAEVFALSRETRRSLAALVPEPIAQRIWR